MKKLSASFVALFISMTALGCGQKGDTGPAGPPGAGRVISTIYCEGTVKGMGGDAVALNGLGVEYNAVLTSGGDVYATANIVDAESQVSGTSFYAAAEAGVANAAVNVTADYIGFANGGYWRVSLNRSTLVTSVIYDDLSLSAPVSMTFTPASCTVNQF